MRVSIRVRSRVRARISVSVRAGVRFKVSVSVGASVSVRVRATVHAYYILYHILYLWRLVGGCMYRQCVCVFIHNWRMQLRGFRSDSKCTKADESNSSKPLILTLTLSPHPNAKPLARVTQFIASQVTSLLPYLLAYLFVCSSHDYTFAELLSLQATIITLHLYCNPH